MTKNEFRITSILSVLLGGSVVGAIALFAIAFSLMLARAFGRPVLPAIIGRGADVLIFVFAALAVFYVALTFVAWWARRDALSKVEHRVILGILLLVSSVVCGVVNFGIYAVDDKAFSVSKEKVESWQEARAVALESLSVDAKQQAEWCQSLQRRLEPLGNSRFKFKSSVLPHFVSHVYPLDVPLKGVEIALFRESGFTPIWDTWSLGVREGTKSIYFDPAFIPGAETVVLKPDSDGVSKQYILNILHFGAKWENYRGQLVESRNSKTVPLAAFVYQSVMAALGDNPEYVQPNSATTRALAFAFAIAKFLYLGVFIALVVDKESKESIAASVTGVNDESS